VEGSPVIITLPVATEQVGWVIAPTIGAVGISGAAFITTSEVGSEVHPSVFVTVKVYDPSARPVTV
jgi:hypothetical protein